MAKYKKGDRVRIVNVSDVDKTYGWFVGDITTVEAVLNGLVFTPHKSPDEKCWMWLKEQVEPAGRSRSRLLKDIALSSGALFVFMLFLGIAERILA